MERNANDTSRILETGRITKNLSANIEFNNLSYFVGKKQILNRVSGKFASGQLTAILGGSGSGKTSLLNVLAGYVHSGVKGTVSVNGLTREAKDFRSTSCYIMQENLLQPLLTVGESMTMAARFKLGNRCSSKEKEAAIDRVVDLMGLSSSLDTFVESMSGGEKKRLSIALEIVGNTPIIFLDEPTTGLDNVAAKKCVDVLNSLTAMGLTVVCSIHQPADSVFKLFDQAYFMHDGFCVYNGSADAIVPFLASADISCPITHSPADYLIELVILDNLAGPLLKDQIQNGKVKFAAGDDDDDEVAETNWSGIDSSYCDYPASFWLQFYALSLRMFTQTKRNKIALGLQFGHVLLSSIFLGILFYNTGNSTVSPMLQHKFFFIIVIYLMFTHVMTQVLLFPFEVRLLQREYFNRWYSLRAYFAAITVSTLPVILITTTLLISVLYVATDQPLELDRYSWFLSISLIFVVTSQGLGFWFGSLFRPTVGACLGSAAMIIIMVVAMCTEGDVSQSRPIVHFLQSLSFSRRGFVGLSVAALNGRRHLDCKEIFCYFDVEKNSELVGIVDTDLPITEAGCLLVFMLLHRVLMFLTLTFRVKTDFKLHRYLKLGDYE